jgi:hypothetical protein
LSVQVLASQAQETYMGRRVSQTLKFLSPLQSFTIFPKEIPTTSPRNEFLPKFQKGLEAEKNAREHIAKNGGLDSDEAEYVGKGWEKRSEEREKSRAELEDKYVQNAYDEAVAKVGKAAPSKVVGSKYQFVGVVQPSDSEKSIKWYARKRPANSKWNVRLLHVNRDVILRDLFVNGKVDMFAKYVNTGKARDELKEGEDPSAPRRPLISAQYNVKKRSALNLWNFSPKHFFTDSSGAFWRERRLAPGLYTDGKLVYEQKYRYSDGKNGMKPISRLDALLRSKSIKDEVKVDLLKRLEKDTPDIVIEK